MSAVPKTIHRYEIVERLGQGGMGDVYLGRDPMLDRFVAIKMLRAGWTGDDLHERFAREARSAARLAHINIVTIYDVGEHEGQPYIAMEYVLGETLLEKIRRRSDLPLATKLQYVDELCAGLAHAHRAGIIHRDIKPANLIVSPEGTLKILDFGIARLADSSMTQAGLMLGTLNYMSPEQISGLVVDHRSDIFAVGAVFYELLSFQQAFPGGIDTVLSRILHGTPAPLTQLCPGLDVSIIKVVERALAKTPDERFEDLTTMRAELSRARRRLDAKVLSAPVTTARPSAGEMPIAVPTPGHKTPRRSTPREEIQRRRTEEVASHLANAHNAFAAGKFEEASAACERALIIEQDHEEALDLSERARAAIEQNQIRQWALDARIEVEQGNIEAAQNLLSSIVALDAESPEARDLRVSIEQLEARHSADKGIVEGRHVLDSGDAAAAVAATREAPEPSADSGAVPMPNTIRAAPPPSLAPPAALVDHTVFIPAGNAAPGRKPARARVRVTVVQCGDASVVNQSFDLGESFEIGREGGHLRADDMTWSRRHAVIVYVNDGYAIRDLGSTSGTYVNGRRVRPNAEEPLLFGARITIGGSVLVLSPAADTRLPDLTGALVANRYVLERLLRTSSKGAIYAARQQTIALRHALKLLSPALLDYPGYRDRFRREAEVAIELHHPHICEVQDYGETTITPPGKTAVTTAYLCLRLMTGGTLADRLDAREQIAVADVGRWIDSLGDALAYAHDRNVVHGDIKPAAIVFDDGGNAYLTDFAIGQPREGDSTPGVIGTPAYMAPEQWEGQPSTRATDQFGLAALAYYMVAGVRPFEGQDNEEIRRRNFAHGPLAAHKEAARLGRQELYPAVSEVLARGLALSADDRYADLREFARDFNDALSGRRDQQNAHATPRVFLSYQRAGGAGLPLFIVSQLEQHGIEVFLDVQRVDGAVKFPERLTREIQKADVFVCLLGPETLESRWVRHEIELACKHRKPMIPVFHEQFVVPDHVVTTEIGELLSFDGIRLMDQQNLYVQEGVEKLARQVHDTVAHRRRRQ